MPQLIRAPRTEVRSRVFDARTSELGDWAGRNARPRRELIQQAEPDVIEE